MSAANPALGEQYFRNEAALAPSSTVMTIQGTVLKTGALMTLVVAVAAIAWSMVFPQGIAGATDKIAVDTKALIGFGGGGLIGGFVLGLIMCFAPKSSPICAPLYAVCEGGFLGALSGFYAHGYYPTIVLQAGMLTIGVMVMMLTLYGTGIIKMSDKLRLGITAAVGAVGLVYLATCVMYLFGAGIPSIYQSGTIGIAFSAIVVVIAAMNLVLAFDNVETGARYGAPKYMEWYASFGLLVALVWLYLEILRLLAKLNSSRD
jgi:uncharacterized YccA/Bax inhibitor family protein